MILYSLLLTLAQLSSVAPGGFWPATAVGWITTFGFVLMLIGAVIGWGKMLEKLNGYGGRLSEVESEQEKALGAAIVTQRTLDRILDQHDGILKQLGEAKRTAEKCGEDTDAMGYRIEAKVDAVRDQVTKVTLDVAQRLAGLEARLVTAKII